MSNYNSRHQVNGPILWATQQHHFFNAHALLVFLIIQYNKNRQINIIVNYISLAMTGSSFNLLYNLCMPGAQVNPWLRQTDKQRVHDTHSLSTYCSLSVLLIHFSTLEEEEKEKEKVSTLMLINNSTCTCDKI